MMHTIDLNCDMGEGFGNYQSPDDALLMDYISSANIACGFHAGDPDVMQRTVAMAVKKGIAIGAHPGLPDLQGFGRRELKISAREAYQMTMYQIGALAGFVRAAGGRLNHVKPHGALYNMAAKDTSLAEAIILAVKDFDPGLMLYALSGSAMIRAAQSQGISSASEVFADRTYQNNGMLTPRQQPDAMIEDEQTSLNQVLRMIRHQEVLSLNHTVVPLKVETICLHGDGAHAVDFAKNMYTRLSNEGITIKAPAR